jgi:hypothetical protein
MFTCPVPPRPFPVNKAEVSALTSTAGAVARPQVAVVVSTDSDSPHVASLKKLPVEAFNVFANVAMSTYEVRRPYMAEELRPCAVDVLPGVTAAVVYDFAVALGVPVLGVVPAHNRRGKWTVAVPGNPPRVYAGPNKLPYEAATQFSPPVKP